MSKVILPCEARQNSSAAFGGYWSSTLNRVHSTTHLRFTSFSVFCADLVQKVKESNVIHTESGAYFNLDITDSFRQIRR